MSYTPRCIKAVAVLATFVLALTSFGCTSAPTNSNANLNANASVAVNANSNTSTPTAGAFTTREPENYSATMTVSAQGEASNRQGGGSVQVDFAKLGADRRWAFQLQQVGPVTYLEKSGLRYLILPSRNQYVEISPNDLGFNLGNLMTPATMVEQLKSRTQYETLGTETINGRTATKYRFAGSADTRTQAGTAQTDSIVYVDQETGLPLRSEVNIVMSSGANARIATETSKIDLSPQPSLFEVPAGLNKVTTEQLKQQVQNFVQTLQIFLTVMRQQQGGAPPPPPPPPTATGNANLSPTNANANRQ